MYFATVAFKLAMYFVRVKNWNFDRFLMALCPIGIYKLANGQKRDRNKDALIVMATIQYWFITVIKIFNTYCAHQSQPKFISFVPSTKTIWSDSMEAFALDQTVPL